MRQFEVFLTSKSYILQQPGIDLAIGFGLPTAIALVYGIINH